MDNNMLSELLNDPEKLKSALSAASGLLGANGDAPPSRPAPRPTPPPEPQTPPQAAPAMQQNPFAGLGAISGMGGARPSPNGGYDPSAELMRRVMPVIQTFARSGQQAVNRDRANLLQSFKPFVTESVGNQFDHAIRLVSIARMTKNAMLQLGGTDGQSALPDGTKAL